LPFTTTTTLPPLDTYCFIKTIVAGGEPGCGSTSNYYEDWTFSIQDLANCTIDRNAPVDLKFYIRYNYYEKQDTGEIGPIEQNIIVTVPAGQHSVTQRFYTLYNEFCNFSSLCNGTCYSQITGITLYAAQLGFDCSTCNQTTTTTSTSTTTSTTTAAPCDAMEFSFTPTGSNAWGNTGPMSVITGSLHNYYIVPQRSGASFPQTFSYIAEGSINFATQSTWIVSSSSQPSFTASVRWDNVADTAGLKHAWTVSGSNCAGESARSVVQVNVYGGPCNQTRWERERAATNWAVTGSQRTSGSATELYYIYSQASGATYPQTYTIYATGSVNADTTPYIWVVSSSYQAQTPYTASITWNNNYDPTGVRHALLVSSSNPCGVNSIIYQVEVF
jgi:hypothetical protein